METDNIALLKFATALAEEAGDVALSFYKDRDHLVIERKNALDLVTRADREVEKFLRSRIKAQYPNDAFFGEESCREHSPEGRTWVVDPIDGTFNFLRGNKDWGIAVSLLQSGIPQLGVINAPARGELLASRLGSGAFLNGERLMKPEDAVAEDVVVGVGFGPSVSADHQSAFVRFVSGDCRMTFRRNGASTVSLIMLAQGQLDAFVGLAIHSWDVLAGVVAVQELGQTCSIQWKKTDLGEKIDVVCAPKQLRERLSRFQSPGSASYPLRTDVAP